MTPRVPKKSNAEAETETGPQLATHALAAPASEAEKALRALREQVQKSSEYVGDSFAREARAIHDGEAPERSIYGEASVQDARALSEEGIPVAPLPFLPTRKTN